MVLPLYFFDTVGKGVTVCVTYSIRTSWDKRFPPTNTCERCSRTDTFLENAHFFLVCHELLAAGRSADVSCIYRLIILMTESIRKRHW